MLHPASRPDFRAAGTLYHSVVVTSILSYLGFGTVVVAVLFTVVAGQCVVGLLRGETTLNLTDGSRLGVEGFDFYFLKGLQ